MAFHVEKHPLVHEPRLGEGHDAARVGEIAGVGGGLQLDQRHAAAGLVVDDLDLEVAARLGSRGMGSVAEDAEEKEGEDVAE